MLPEQETGLETTSPKRLKTLAKVSLPFARIVAANPVAPIKLLRNLAIAPDPKIRKAVTSNPNTPIKDLIRLSQQFPR
jgi:hypothetical protein